ncbi:MAG TPA: hypothetical protein VHG10_01455 [Glycomyces sp.]|nr:hypothetical protein [Glycomyces sp.]
MNDQYRISGDTPPAPAPMGHYQLLTVALWIGLLAGAVLNTGLQMAGLHLVAIPFGALGAACGIALIVRAVVGRRGR